MFKKFLSTMLLSTLFATSVNATVSEKDIADKDLSSSSILLQVQNFYNQRLSESLGKKTTIDVLKSSKTSKVSIKNGTCEDYARVAFMAENMAQQVLSESEQDTRLSKENVQKILIMTYRILRTVGKTVKTLCK